MQDGRFPFEVIDGVPVVAAPEEIDITNAPELRVALLEAAAHGNGTIVADLTRTQFCDSSGLHTLLAAHKRAQAEDGEMLLVIGGTAVLRVFAITGVDRMIPNFTSLEEALTQTSANDQPQAVTAHQLSIGSPVPGERIGDLAGIGYLADHLFSGSPNLHRSAAVGVAEGVADELADGEHQVGYARRREPGLPG